MALDIKKCFKVALLPAAVVFIVGLVGLVLLGILPNYIYILFGMVVFAWSGYRAVKKESMDIAGGTISGLIGGAMASAIILGIGFAHILTSGTGIENVTANGPVFLGLVSVLAFGTGVTIYAIAGAIGGAIGAFIAERTMKK